MIGFLLSPQRPPEPPPADRFRLGDIWRSPWGKYWQVDRIKGHKARLRALHNRRTTQWRFNSDNGRDMTNAWVRIESAADQVAYPK